MKITFICLGNICRSPMAEFICKDMIKKNNFGLNVEVNSAGTSGWNDGDDMHQKTKSLLLKNNIECENFVSKKINKKLFDESDYILVMDDSNLNDMISKFGNNNKIIKITKYSSNKNINYVPDPWYTGNFHEVYKILNDCINNFLITIKKSA